MRYSSSIVFLYYKDLEYGKNFMTKVLDLEQVMDQGSACVYRINSTSFIGVVHSKDPEPGCTLVSLNTDNVEKEYERLQKLPIFESTDIKYIESIPLKTFFFSDYEGHRFEVEEFQLEEDKKMF
jgi:predicted enzyme related to lactoylglutathione lyase